MSHCVGMGCFPDVVASKYPEMHSTLNLVCHRVKQWIEPFEMECLFLASPLTRHPMVCKQRHWEWFSAKRITPFLQSRRHIANGVRGLMLGRGIVDDPSFLYALLPSLEYVVFGMRHRTVICFPEFSLSSVLSLPIRRLGFDIHARATLELFATTWSPQPGSLSFTLTHLELPSFRCIGTYIEDLPALSHLSIDLNQHRDVKLFIRTLAPHRHLLQRVVARKSFRLLVLRILPYKILPNETIHAPGIYKPLLQRCSIPVQKVLCLETSVDAALGLCHYYTGAADMWCEAEAAMGGRENL
ncbi:hypothetical protein C8R44DRAFT_869668 [Mycena epipterygia]|nr:hypothetical protein C8R44DRAFT_869668 [Mycena epipterygia]